MGLTLERATVTPTPVVSESPAPAGTPTPTITPTPVETVIPTPAPEPTTIDGAAQVVQLVPEQWQYIGVALVLLVFVAGVLLAVKI